MSVEPLKGGVRRRLIMATVILASSVYVVDVVTIAIALPHMQGTFAATPVEIAWVATSFVLGATAMVACVGWISTRVGVRRLFAISIACFMVFAVGAANADSLAEEVVWRLLMGAAGAAIHPLAQLILLSTYPKSLAGQAIAVWGTGALVVPLMALPIAGYVIDLFGWSGVFYMVLPIGAIALVGTLTFVPEVKNVTPRRPLDGFGLTLLIIGLGALQYALSRGARQDWFASTEIVVSAIVFAACAYAFAVHSATTRNPLLPASLFRHRNLSLGLAGVFVFGLTLTLVNLLLALMLQNQLGYPVELSALTLAPRFVGIVIGQYLVAVLIVRMDSRHLLAAGAVIAASMTWVMSGWSLAISPWQVMWPLLLHGIGDGFIWMSMNPLAVGTVPEHHRSQAVPLYFLSFNVGFSTGVAGIMTYWTTSSQSNHTLLAELFTRFASPSSGLPSQWEAMGPTVAAAMTEEIARQAAMIAYNNCFFVISLGTLLLVPIAYLMRDPGWRHQ
jgi:DHA2 family multidrug resistance protein